MAVHPVPTQPETQIKTMTRTGVQKFFKSILAQGQVKRRLLLALIFSYLPEIHRMLPRGIVPANLEFLFMFFAVIFFVFILNTFIWLTLWLFSFCFSFATAGKETRNTSLWHYHTIWLNIHQNIVSAALHVNIFLQEPLGSWMSISRSQIGNSRSQKFQELYYENWALIDIIRYQWKSDLTVWVQLQCSKQILLTLFIQQKYHKDICDFCH